MSVSKLSEARAAKTGDCRQWSVVDCLEAALEEARSGKWQKCLLVFKRDEDDVYYIDLRVAGCTRLEVRGMMFEAVKEEVS